MASQHLAADPQQLEEQTPGGSSDSIHRREESSEITFKLLGLKSGFIFSPVVYTSV